MDVSGFLGGNFLTHLDLPQPYQVWTIAKIDQQLVGQGQTAEQKICVTFSEHNKPLAMNKTNLKRTALLYSTNANAWGGKQVLVYRSSTTYGNDTVLCIRVCGPTQPPLDPICDAQGIAVLFQAVAQPTTSPAPQSPPAPISPPAAQPVAAPAAQSQPAAVPRSAAPWDQQNEDSPPSA